MLDVAIVIGNYKQEKWFAGACHSAVSQVPTTYAHGPMPNFKTFPVTDTEGIGAAAFRNKTIARIDAQWFIWLDADDLLASNFVYEMWKSHQIQKYFSGDPENTYHVAPVQFISGCRLDCIPYLDVEGTDCPFGMSAMFSKNLWGRHGFDEKMPSMNDLDFWYRIGQEPNTLDTKVSNTRMFKRDVGDSSLSKLHNPLAQFNAKHDLTLETNLLPYMIPRTDLY